MQQRSTPRLSLRAAALLLLVGAASCASNTIQVSDSFLDAQPRSILVLPPLNNTVEVGSSYGVLSSVTVPLAEAGYYVFPVAVVDEMMRQNGLPTPDEMHSVSIAKLDEIFAPDAVLYLTVTDWGTSYQLLNSTTRVSIEGRLVDTKTGGQLWTGTKTQMQNSSAGQTSLFGMLAGAIVNQVATNVSDPSPALARRVNYDLLRGESNGWILGPYHPEAEAERDDIRRRKLEAAAR